MTTLTEKKEETTEKDEAAISERDEQTKTMVAILNTHMEKLVHVNRYYSDGLEINFHGDLTFKKDEKKYLVTNSNGNGSLAFTADRIIRVYYNINQRVSRSYSYFQIDLK